MVKIRKIPGNQYWHNQSGFSLTEMMIVCLIIAVLGGTFLLGIRANRGTRNLHTNARELVSFLQEARFRSVKENRCYGIALRFAGLGDLTGLDQRGSFIYFEDTDCDGQCDAVLCGGGGAEDRFISEQFVRDDVALTQVPNITTANDPNEHSNPRHGLFSSISFNSQSLVSTAPDDHPLLGGRAIAFRNNPNPAFATWWSRVVVLPTGMVEYQTNNDPANEASWSR